MSRESNLFDFHVTFGSITDLPEQASGKNVFLSWKSKDFKGRSVSVLVSNLASFSVNDTQIISCSLQKNSKSSGFVERKITFALGLETENGKEIGTIGEFIVNLSEATEKESGRIFHEKIALKSSKYKSQPIIELKIVPKLVEGETVETKTKSKSKKSSNTLKLDKNSTETGTSDEASPLSSEELSRHSPKPTTAPSSRKNIFGRIKSSSSRSLKVESLLDDANTNEGISDIEYEESKSVADPESKKKKSRLPSIQLHGETSPRNSTSITEKESNEKKKRKKKEKGRSDSESTPRAGSDSDQASSCNSPNNISPSPSTKEMDTTSTNTTAPSDEKGDNIGKKKSSRKVPSKSDSRRNTPKKNSRAQIRRDVPQPSTDAETETLDETENSAHEIAIIPTVKPISEKRERRASVSFEKPPLIEEAKELPVARAPPISELDPSSKTTDISQSNLEIEKEKMTKSTSKDSIGSGSTGLSASMSKIPKDSLIIAGRSSSTGGLIASMGKSLSRGMISVARNASTTTVPQISNGTSGSGTVNANGNGCENGNGNGNATGSGLTNPNMKRRSLSLSSMSRSGGMNKISFADDTIVGEKGGGSGAESPLTKSGKKTPPTSTPVDVGTSSNPNTMSGSATHSPRGSSKIEVTRSETGPTPPKRGNSFSSATSPASFSALNNIPENTQLKMVCNDLTHLSLTFEKQQLLNKCNEKEMTISHLEAIIEKQRSEINSHVESLRLANKEISNITSQLTNLESQLSRGEVDKVNYLEDKLLKTQQQLHDTAKENKQILIEAARKEREWRNHTNDSKELKVRYEKTIAQIEEEKRFEQQNFLKQFQNLQAQVGEDSERRIASLETELKAYKSIDCKMTKDPDLDSKNLLLDREKEIQEVKENWRRLEKLQQFREKISVFLNFMTPSFDDMGRNLSAKKLAEFLIDSTTALDAQGQFDFLNKKFMLEINQSLYRAYHRRLDNIQELASWINWSCTFISEIVSKISDRRNILAVPNIDKLSHNFIECGIKITFPAGSELQEYLRRFEDWATQPSDLNKLEKNVDGNPVAQFLHLMNVFITHMFALLVRELEKQSEEKYNTPLVLTQDVHLLTKPTPSPTKQPLKTHQHQQKHEQTRKPQKPPQTVEAWLSFLTSTWSSLHSTSRLPTPLLAQIFLQLFHIVNAKVFNFFIDTPSACIATRGCAVKMNVSKIEQWALSLSGSVSLVDGVREQFTHSLEAASLLILDKAFLAFAEAKSSVFPNLTPIQAQTLLSQSHTDEFAQESGKKRELTTSTKGSDTHITTDKMIGT